jgi:hypothetical protein
MRADVLLLEAFCDEEGEEVGKDVEVFVTSEDEFVDGDDAELDVDCPSGTDCEFPMDESDNQSNSNQTKM